MKKTNLVFSVITLLVFLSVSACKQSTSTATTTDTGGGTNGGTGTGNINTTTGLTDASLVGTWFSSCLSFTPVVTGSGTSYHQLQFIVTTSGTYYYQDLWYNNSSCGGGHWIMELKSGGTYALGSLSSGSTAIYNIVYTTNGSDSSIEPIGQNEPISYNGGSGLVTTVPAWLTSYGCNGGGTFSTDGLNYAQNSIGCGLSQMPGTGTSVYNIIEISDTAMTIGSTSTSFFAPGQLTTGAVAATPTLILYKQ